MPKPARKPIIVTSALPYANGPIHVGHLVEYIQTDIFVRFLKSIGEDAVYCCADDTHGTPIQISAEKEGILPEQLIERYHNEHLRDFTRFLIHFDSYYSTNSKESKYFSDLIFNRLRKKGLVYKKEVELSYCNKCKKFLPDRYIKGRCPKCHAADQYGDVCESCNATYKTTDLIEPYCTICGDSPKRRLSSHYFFRLSYYAGKLKEWFAKNKSLQPEIINYLNNWIKEGLQDWDISRDGPYFGFRIPDEEDLYYYVWLDAPIGYISSFSNILGGDVKKAERQWNKFRIIHFIGKDIIYFHFLFWPAMLLGAGLQLPESIIVHGFLTVNKEKMSKSRGTFYTAEEFANKYNPEYLRFYYAKVLSRKLSDIDLDFRDFQKSINNELVGNIANFCYRVLIFTNKFFDSEVKQIEPNRLLISDINSRINKVRASYYDINYNEALKEILSVCDLGNQYFQKNEPWKLIRTDKEKAHRIIGFCVNLVKNISILIGPILPGFSDGLQQQLGLSGLKWKDINFNYRNRKISTASILIDKLEEAIKEVFPLDLRVARIEKVKDHPEADKLYVLDIDIGQKRQIVAGLREHYKKKELEGKSIIVVSNLKPAKLRGVVSQGMLLAAEHGKDIKVLFADGTDGKPGDEATFFGTKNSTQQVTFEQFSKLDINVLGKRVLCSGRTLNVNGKDLIVDIKDGAKIR